VKALSDARRPTRFTVQVGPETLARLDAIAVATQRTRAALVREAVVWFCTTLMKGGSLPSPLILDRAVPTGRPGPDVKYPEAASFGLDPESSDQLQLVLHRTKATKAVVVRRALACWLAARLEQGRPYTPDLGDSEWESRLDAGAEDLADPQIDLVTTGQHPGWAQ
jgi:predicted transcriptional regulator